jgi:hypothetical protein
MDEPTDAELAEIAAMGEITDDGDAEELVEEAATDEDSIPAELSEHAQAEAEALRAGVGAALDLMIKREQVEIPQAHLAVVVEELTTAGLEARNPRHLLKKLRKALVNSEAVEEVYAGDRTLDNAFRRALGG